MSQSAELFTPVAVGRYTLANRIMMAPMTRSRADDNGVTTEWVAHYYAQRATAGLLISEGVYPSPMGKGYIHTPGIHSDSQVAAWKRVTDAVHAKGGRIFAQVMHAGRISDPSFLPGGAAPVAPSAVRPDGQSYTADGPKPHVTPRALATDEIAGIVEEYRSAARRALEAGFDGVELHSASGYLPEQFLSSKTNLRTDRYGGSVANRARFVLEVLEAMIAEAGSDRVGIKIAPEMRFNDIDDANPQETYGYLVKQLADLNLAYLHVAVFGTPSADYHALLRPLFRGAYLAGGGLTKDAAQRMIQEDRADAAVFGALFIANPDLVERFRRNAPLNAPNPDTFYTPGPQGYIDYPVLDAA